MDREAAWLLGLGVAAAVLIALNASTVGDAAQSGVEDVQAALTGWQSVGAGPVWVPVLNEAEAAHGIPANLLARIAYQESRFRPDVISGATVSSAGALGLMQLEPAYFASVRVPRPFSAADTSAQISEAAAQLAALFTRFQDWGLAVAAYNDGAGNIDAYLAGTRSLPQETANYVADVLGDVPVPGGSFLA